MGKNKTDDLKVAANTSHIDIILGGHTHTFMDKPHISKTQNNNDVILFQSGQNGVRLGRIDLLFEKNQIKADDTRDNHLE